MELQLYSFTFFFVWFIASAKKAMVLPGLVCLSVCLSVCLFVTLFKQVLIDFD